MDQQAFKAAREAEGFTEFLIREWEPGKVVDTHSHDFTAAVLVLEGEFTVDYDDGPTTYRPGDSCVVEAGTRHKETVGAEGVKFLVGRK